MLRTIKLPLIGLTILFLLAACSVPEEEAIKATETAVKQAFEAEANKANQNDDTISFWIPEDVKIDSMESNNIILKKDEQVFLLFYNPLESPESETIYKDLKNRDDLIQLTKFTEDKNEHIGFLAVAPMEEKTYEMIVGVGASKITTETETDTMEEDAKLMMEIIDSISLNEK